MLTIDLADRLRVVVGRVARRLRQQSLGGLTPSQASILSTLERHGPLSMSEIAQHEGIAKPSATGIVRRLIDKGLVTKTADPADGRSAIVEIEVGGRALLEQRRKERTAYLSSRIDALDDEERVALERAVSLLESVIEDQ